MDIPLVPFEERRGKLVRYGTMLTLAKLKIYNTNDATYTPTWLHRRWLGYLG